MKGKLNNAKEKFTEKSEKWSEKADKKIKNEIWWEKKEWDLMRNQKMRSDEKLKNKDFLIKIADLLNETGKKDSIYFDNKFSDQIKGLEKKGISGTFTIQSLNNDSILWTLDDTKCRINETCESCGNNFTRNINIPTYTARFVDQNEWAEEKNKNSDEDVFLINLKDETINIEDMIVQAIVLNDPFVKRCEECEKRLEKESEDENNVDYFESKGNIVFN